MHLQDTKNDQDKKGIKNLKVVKSLNKNPKAWDSSIYRLKIGLFHWK